MKYILKKYCLIISNNGNLWRQLLKKSTANKSSSVKKTKQNRLIISSNISTCGKKKINFFKTFFYEWL